MEDLSQGNVLSTILFNISIDDILKINNTDFALLVVDDDIFSSSTKEIPAKSCTPHHLNLPKTLKSRKSKSIPRKNTFITFTQTIKRERHLIH